MNMKHDATILCDNDAPCDTMNECHKRDTMMADSVIV